MSVRSLISALVCTLSLPVMAGSYQVVGESTSEVDLPLGKLLVTETVVQEGEHDLDRFTVHRVRRAQGAPAGTLLLLPSLGNSFRMYEIDAGGQYARSFAGFFARLGYDVWGYSPRATGIEAGACAGALDCTPALQWGLQTVVDDVTFIRGEIEALYPGDKPAIGGLSLGSAAALAVVNQYPLDYRGLIAWEGSLVTDDPAIRAHTLPYCDLFEELLDDGVPVEDQSLPFVKEVAALAAIAPDDPLPPIPDFPPGLTNHEAFVFVLSEPNPLAPSVRPGFISAAGSVATDALTYSSDARLMANIEVFNDVTANRLSRDLYCSLAGVETSFTDNLASFSEPTLVIKAGQGFGPIMDELPGKLGSTDVGVLGFEAFAHVDHLGSSLHKLVLEGPIALWLALHVL